MLNTFRNLFSQNQRRRRRNTRLTGESLESRVLLTTVFVTSEADSGPGTFRDAVDAANNDPNVDRIRFANSVDSIDLDSSVEYTGSQNLRINGRGATVEAGEGDEGAFDLFVSSGGADLRLRNISFADGRNGVFVPVPADTTGTVRVSLRNTAITGSSLFGLHVADQINNSDASIALSVYNSEITGNGTGELDFDGVRVDEGGNGSLFARIVNSQIDSNGGDGLELDERGGGSVLMHVWNSSFNGNGFFNTEDLDDGLDIDEEGDGGIYASIWNSEFNENYDEGLDLDEEGEGGLRLYLRNIDANDNIDEGVKADEEDEGSVWVNFRNVTANGSEDQEGIAISEVGDGGLYAYLRNVTANSNDKDGIDITEEDNGSLYALLRNIETSDNGDNGTKLEETGAGNVRASVANIESNSNGEYGLEVTQETVGADTGRLRVWRSLFEDNDEGDLFTEGID